MLGGALERMREGMAEVEQRAVAVLALVAGDGRGLRLATRATAKSRSAPPESTPNQLSSHHAKKAASSMRPYFTTSA